MLIFTFTTVIISMGYTRGLARYYIVAAEFLAFLLVRFTLGQYVVRIFGLIFTKTGNIIKIVTEFASKIAKKLLQPKHNI